MRLPIAFFAGCSVNSALEKRKSASTAERSQPDGPGRRHRGAAEAPPSVWGPSACPRTRTSTCSHFAKCHLAVAVERKSLGLSVCY
ncbi:hypothetical protein EVAR_33555_1 [Eumeta japonica]|uniref:Uncharacterized protein n=1 Tax=Eumeta variegata TaxID=151549 RepID=A0A4C1VLP2_EUMVA|nr:hypothetical protein EVAR_33555_1 [Eumeta japonica]